MGLSTSAGFVTKAIALRKEPPEAKATRGIGWWLRHGLNALAVKLPQLESDLSPKSQKITLQRIEYRLSSWTRQAKPV